MRIFTSLSGTVCHFKYGFRVTLLLLIIPLAGYSQTIVRGTVLDKLTGEPVIGASIIEKQTTNGTITDVDGVFSLHTNSTIPIKIAISFIGYKSREIDIETSNQITVYLEEDAGKLNEIVVVGYGTQKRKELTGSIASVPKEILENNVAPTLDGLLGGAVAGVAVTQSSGQPGNGSSIRIRGGNSIHANNDPLYVIDGFLFYRDASSTKTGLGGIEGSLNPLSTINPADIESIEVLKDVSATAIYGSRGANGVIIVTTKKGKKGEAAIHYRFTIGASKTARKLDILNASEWARIHKSYFTNKGGYTDEQIAQLGEGYDWQDAVLQTGLTPNHEISISGGDDKTRYLISGNFVDQKGIVINSGFKRYNARINLERELRPNLTVGLSTILGKSRQNSLTTTEPVNFNSSPFSAGITNSLTYALFMPPVVPIYNSNGSYNYRNPYEYAYFALGDRAVNPVSDLQNSVAESISNTILGNFFARYTITDGLVAKFSAGVDASQVTQNFFAPSYTAIGLGEVGVGGIGNKKYESWQTEYTLGYTKKLNSAHFIDVLAGYTYQGTTSNHVRSIATRFSNDRLKHNNLAGGAVSYPSVSGISNASLNSLIGRVNYTFLERYNLTATFRADNSSRFARTHRWGYFPSLGVSWNLNEERFLRDARHLSLLKIRASAGTVGNQEIGDYEYVQQYQATRYNGGTSYTRNTLGNANLKWETTAQYNIGADAGFFQNRLNFVADAYYKKTSDLLFNAPVDPSQGVSDQLINIGNVTNKGVELAVNAIILERRHLSWSANANIARNINRIENLGETRRLIQGTFSEQVLQVGQPLGAFYGLVFDGVVQADERIEDLPVSISGPLKPGDIKFRDVSGSDGRPDGRINDLDRTVLGNIQPNFIYGFSTTLTYHQFDLFALIQGSKGGSVFNGLRRTLEQPTDAYNMSSSILNSWTAENPSNTIPYITDTRPYSYIDSRFVEDASFLKLRNLTLGYNLDLPRLKSKVRVFVSGQNVLRITRYKGYDPEVPKGLDIGSYPVPRTLLAGFSLSL